MGYNEGWGLKSHSKLPGRETHSSPTPGFILHQVLPFTASPNTSKEVFLYSPGRSVNWPAASKADVNPERAAGLTEEGGGEQGRGEPSVSPHTGPGLPFQPTPRARLLNHYRKAGPQFL